MAETGDAQNETAAQGQEKTQSMWKVWLFREMQRKRDQESQGRPLLIS